MRHFLIIFSIFVLALSFYAKAEASENLKIAVLPIADTLLLYVARDKGYFEKNGLIVELIPFQSTVEKDAALQSGQLDGHFCEIASVIIQRASGQAYTVISTTSHTNKEHRMFGLVTSPKTKANSINDLKGKKLAIARQTIVDFLTDKFLENSNLPDDFFDREDIRKIPVRLQLLLSDQIEAVLIPEPMLSVAESAGGTIVLDDRFMDMPLAVIALSEAKATPKTVAAFNLALIEAAKELNTTPGLANIFLKNLNLLPAELIDKFDMPPFDLEKIPKTLPSRDLYDQYINWLIKNKVLATSGPGLPIPKYEDVVYQDQLL